MAQTRDENLVCFQKTDRETDDDLMPTPKTKRRSECEVKKKTPKRAPEDGLRKRLNILYRIVYEYQVGDERK